MSVAGLISKGGPGGLTVSVAVRLWVPRPVSVLVKVKVALYAPVVRLFAFALTVKVTGVPEDAIPELEEGVSQFGTPEIE